MGKGEIKWCPNCEKNVRTVKHFSWLWFILLSFTIGGGLAYIIYYIVKRYECPYCGEKDLHPWKTEIEKVWTGKEGTFINEGNVKVWKPEE